MVLHYVAVSAEESDIGRQTVWLKQARSLLIMIIIT